MATIAHPITPYSSAHHHHHHHHLPISTPTTLSTAISSATSLPHLKQIHTQILRHHFHRSNSLLFHLLLSSLPFPSGGLSYALSVFSTIPNPEPHLYNKLLRQLSRSKNTEMALLVLQVLLNKGLVIDRFSFPPLFKAAAKASALFEGKTVHGLGLKLGFCSDPFVQTALVGMYASCNKIQEARVVFDKMSHRDVVAWTIMIDGYCQVGLFDDVFVLMEEMKSANVELDERVFSTTLSACARAGNLDVGKVFHRFLAENNVRIDSYIQNSLVNMYASCDSMDVAQALYDELSPKSMVASTAMVSGYSKVGLVEAARSIFDQMVEKDLICWSAMISGYADSDQPEEALKLFSEMQVSGLNPDQVTMLSVISACAHLGALDQAKEIHVCAENNGFGEALPINNALVDMYAKCGSLEEAREVFGRMRRKNVISWTSMITAFAVHGDAVNALTLFSQMKEENVEPNWVTFVGVLYSCSHAGLVEEGRTIFNSMVNEYRITPKHEHYGCMVDLFGRAKLLREALEVVESMPFAPNVIIWGSLMAACRIHGELELGEFAAKQLLQLDPNHDGAHVFLSNIYAKERRWENVGELRKSMQYKGITKERGCSKVEVDNQIHEFMTADKNHKQADQIYAKLDEVVGELKKVGYVQNAGCVLIDVDEDDKKEAVLWHSEKLALCYSLMREGDTGSCIRIIKNLRICEDCHNFMKLASTVYEREIIVRDRTRFHHYRNGSCSCKDFW
ncbi:hypothetical protein ACH5RR_031316 [Cinchona calisaya]|uniref:DYW domain-containing protein n=1 Tax=Cinchona calisaya TaxID=153742 RepID=A0ABD2YEV0_9GENT